MRQMSKNIVIISAFAILLILSFGLFFLRDRSNNPSALKNTTDDKHLESSIKETDEQDNLPENVSLQEDELPIISSAENKESEKTANDSDESKEENSGSDVSQDGGDNAETKEDEIKLPFIRVD